MSAPTLSAVVTCHARADNLVRVQQMLANQTHRPDEVLYYVSGCDLADVWQLYDERVAVVPDRQDWGHEKRAMGLADATSDWVMFVNDDDDYESTYCAEMLLNTTDVDIVLCGFTSRNVGTITTSAPRVAQCTSGNYIVRRELAAEVGWNHRTYEGDGRFIEDLVAAGARWTSIPAILYHHR